MIVQLHFREGSFPALVVTGDDIQRWWDCDQSSINQQPPSPHLLGAAAGAGVAEAIKIKNDGAEKLQGREKPAPSECVQCAAVASIHCS